MTTATCRSNNSTAPFMKFYMKGLPFVALFFLSATSFASHILIPMDADSQRNHLKAYGITYWSLNSGVKVQWLLHSRGGSFLFPDSDEVRKECQIRGISCEVVSDNKTEESLSEISSPSRNMGAVLLERAPTIAVYSPDGKLPWD